MDSLDGTSIGLVVVILIAACAGFFIIRKIVRLLIAVIVLGLSCFVGFKVWEYAPTIALKFSANPPEWIIGLLPIFATILAWFIFRKIARAIADPLRNDQEEAPSNLLFKGGVILFSTALLTVLAVGLIHHFGSIDKLKSLTRGENESGQASLIQKLNERIEKYIPHEFLDKLAPMTSEARMKLAQLIAESPKEPTAEPKEGENPRYVKIKGTLQNLLEEERYSTFLRHPALEEAEENEELHEFLTEIENDDPNEPLPRWRK